MAPTCLFNSSDMWSLCGEVTSLPLNSMTTSRNERHQRGVRLRLRRSYWTSSKLRFRCTSKWWIPPPKGRPAQIYSLFRGARRAGRNRRQALDACDLPGINPEPAWSACSTSSCDELLSPHLERGTWNVDSATPPRRSRNNENGQSPSVLSRTSTTTVKNSSGRCHDAASRDSTSSSPVDRLFRRRRRRSRLDFWTTSGPDMAALHGPGSTVTNWR